MKSPIPVINESTIASEGPTKNNPTIKNRHINKFMLATNLIPLSIPRTAEPGDVGFAVTQPDKARDRGKKVLPTPVKERAESTTGK